MLGKLLIMTGIAIAGAIVYAITKSDKAKDLSDSACENLKEGCRVSAKEKLANKVKGLTDAKDCLVRALTKPAIDGNDVNEVASILDESKRESYVKEQIHYYDVSDRLITIGKVVFIIGGVLIGTGLKFKQIANTKTEQVIAMRDIC